MGFRYNAITGELDFFDSGTAGNDIAQIDTDSGSASPVSGIVNLLGTAAQGISSSAAGNTVILTVDDATTSQKGVSELATDAEAITGTDSSRAIVSSSLKAKLGTQTANSVAVGQGSTSAAGWTSALTNGQVVIGSTGAMPVATSITGGSHLQMTEGAGSLDIDLSSNTNATAIHGWNGSVLETTDITVISDGAIITFSIQKAGGGNLTLVFSDDFTTFVAAPATIALTAGTDKFPQENFVYILQSTKALTVSTSSFPATEFIPLATVYCQSAASLQTDRGMKVHVWTDHVVSTNQQGHISHLNEWIRNQNATWISGVSQTYTININAGSADDVIFTSASGKVFQLHPHTFPAFTGIPDLFTVNDFTTPFNKIKDLNVLLTDSQNVSMSGKFFSLVIWGVVSESTGDCKLMVNLPSGSYNNATALTADANKFATFDIPTEFRGTGFLISRWDLRHRTTASGTWTSINETSLLGQIPGTNAGGGVAASSEFIDTAFRILDDGDNTKEIAFQVSGITTVTTRTLTVQDADGTIALSGVANFGTGAQTFTDHGVLIGSGTSPFTPLAVGTTGQLLIGVSGADPAFGASADADFTFTSATASTSRVLTVSQTDNTAVASNAALQLTVGGTTALSDPYVNWLITGSTTFSAGIDNTDADLWKITDGATPSAGNELITLDPDTDGDFVMTPKGTGSIIVSDGTGASQAAGNRHRLVVAESLSAGVLTLEVNNNETTNAGSNAQVNLYVGGVNAGDPSVFFTVPGGTGWNVGVDNSDTDSFKITTGTTANPSTGTLVLKATTAGEITKPLQPAFLAFQPSTATDVTGDGTVWQLGTVNLTEVYDQNDDFNVNGTVISQVTSKWLFTVFIQMGDLGAAHVTDNIYLTTSNRTYYFATSNPFAVASGGTLTRCFSAEADMDASDTATVSLFVAGGTKTVDIFGQNTTDARTYFSGHMML